MKSYDSLGAPDVRRVSPTKTSKKKSCLPGGQMIPTPRRSILPHARASQVPYEAKIRFFQILVNSIYNSYIFPYSPFKGPPYARAPN